LEQFDRTINAVACEPPGTKTEAAFNAVHHGFGDGNLVSTVSTRAFGIDDDPSLVIDEIVCIVSKEWVGALPCDPCRLWIGQRDSFRRAAAPLAPLSPSLSSSLRAASRTARYSRTARDASSAFQAIG